MYEEKQEMKGLGLKLKNSHVFSAINLSSDISRGRKLPVTPPQQ